MRTSPSGCCAFFKGGGGAGLEALQTKKRGRQPPLNEERASKVRQHIDTIRTQMPGGAHDRYIDEVRFFSNTLHCISSKQKVTTCTLTTGAQSMLIKEDLRRLHDKGFIVGCEYAKKRLRREGYSK